MKKLLLCASLLVSGVAWADIDNEKAIIDKKMAQCFKSAKYPASANICLSDSLGSYQSILKKENILPDNTYSKLTKDCEDNDSNEKVLACQLAVTKYYLYQGDILQYMSNGKYNTGM